VARGRHVCYGMKEYEIKEKGKNKQKEKNTPVILP
jgi:hypothetical protein